MSRKIAIYKSLNIEENEILAVSLLIIQSVFLGIFYGAFDIGAHTLFLKTYPESMIPKAYIISGVVGILLTSAYSKLQAKYKFSMLAKYSFLFISIITILMRLFFEVTHQPWTVFLVFILLGPLNIVAILAFWGTVGRIFNLRQGKRLFGMIDSGQIFGIIISSYTIPLIIDGLHGTKNLFVISTFSIIGAMVVEMLITRKFVVDEPEKNTTGNTPEVTEHEEVSFKSFIKNPYILYMAFFVVFSMFAAFFIQYSFLVVTNEKYPVEDDLAKYLGFFTGSMMIFTFLIKTFVFSKLLKTYGLKVSLLIGPLLLGVFTAIAIISGLVGGFQASSSGFIYFFLFISLSKLFNKTIKDALEVPSFKLLYQSLSKRIRFDIQAKIDGTVNEVSALTSGIILSVLGLIVYIKLIHYSIVLFILLGIWTYITIRLYKEYRRSLEQSLKEDTQSRETYYKGFEQSVIRSQSEVEKAVSKVLEIKTYLPHRYIVFLKELVNKYEPKEIIGFKNKQLFREIVYLHLANQLPDSWAKHIDKAYPTKIKDSYSPKELGNLLKSDEPEQFISALKYIYNQPRKQQLTSLAALLRSHEIKIQRAAIRMCGLLEETETCGTLIEFIDSNDLFADSLIALKQMVGKSSNQLIQIFYKTDISLFAQLCIIHLLSSVNNEQTIRFLLENISHHRKEIMVQTIKSLKILEYTASEKEQPRFFHPITEQAQVISWNIAALATLKEWNEESELYKAVENEYQLHQQILIELLSITYDPKSVEHVKEHLESGTTEGVGYALELFDLFISDEIKPIIIPLFEDVPFDEKARVLMNFFPVEILPIGELIISLMNRDPNLISSYTKRIAIAEYKNFFNEVKPDLIAQLFNPVNELQMLSAQAIQDLVPEKLDDLLTRLEPGEQRKIKQNLKNKLPQKQYIPESKLHQAFFNESMPKSISLVELSDYLNINEFSKSEFSGKSDDFINYFVFLVISNRDLNENSQPTSLQLFFEEQYLENQKWEQMMDENHLIVGIEKIKMNKLFLKNEEFVQNLLILS